MSRSEADRTIKLLEEFGPTYFELSQLMRISPSRFREIAPAISNGVLNHNGKAIPLNADHAQKVAEAVAQMRRALPKAEGDPPTEQDMMLRVESLAGRCEAIMAELDRISHDKSLGVSQMIAKSAITRVRNRALTIGS